MGNRAAQVKSVELALALGFGLSSAVQNALGLNLSELARREGWVRPELSMLLNGHQGRAYPAYRDRLAELLEVTRADVDRFIESERERRAAAALP